MRSLVIALAFTLLAPVASLHAQATYDLAISGGKVVDGTGNPWFYADVGIRDGKIAFIGQLPPLPTTPRIDAQGLVVAPGFIDMHSHSDTLLLEDGLAQSKIRQGVTTEVLGEGSSAGPRVGKLKPQSMLVGGKPVTWSTLNEYFQTLEAAGIAINVVSYVGLNNAWEAVMGESHERPTKEQFREMQRIVEQA